MPWPTKKLGEIISFEKGKKMAVANDGEPYIGIDGLRTNLYAVYTQEKNGVRCKQDDVLLVWDGAHAGTVGTGLRGFVGSTVVKVLHHNSLENKFLFYLLKLFQEKIRAAAQGAAIPHLSKAFINNLKIPLPSLKIQKQIVERLDKIAEAQKLQGELIQKADELFQSLLHQELNPAGKDWEMKKLGEVLEYEQPTKYLVISTDYKDEYPIPVLTAGKSFVLGNTNEKDGIFPKKKLPVIIFDDFTTAIKFVNFPFKVKSSAMKILHAKKNEADIRFMFYKMLTIKFSHDQHKRYWISECSNLKIPLPSLKVQKQIVAKLSAAQEYKSQLLAQKSKLKELFDSVLSKSMHSKL